MRVKLYARLDRYLPEGRAERNEADLEVPKGTTVAEVFRSLNLPPEVCHLVDRKSTRLNSSHAD